MTTSGARFQTIYEDLATAYGIYVKLDRPDGIAWAGSLLAQVMARGGHKEEALSVLDTAKAPISKLGDPQRIAHIAQLRQLIGGGN